MACTRGLVIALAAIFTSLAGGGGAFAAERAEIPKMWLACENGHNYPIRPIAVSREYDLVTGYLVTTANGRGVHLRLVPMGAGYRYAGRGIWFDGERNEAVLNWGTPHATPCTVMQE